MTDDTLTRQSAFTPAAEPDESALRALAYHWLQEATHRRPGLRDRPGLDWLQDPQRDFVLADAAAYVLDRRLDRTGSLDLAESMTLGAGFLFGFKLAIALQQSRLGDARAVLDELIDEARRFHASEMAGVENAQDAA